MLAELINAVVGLGRKTTEFKFHEHPQMPGRVWITHGDEREQCDAPSPLRAHQLAGFDDLVAALSDKTLAKSPEIYVAADQIVAFLDREERRATVRLALQETSRWKKVMALQTPSSMQPKDVVKMLKLELHGGNVAHVIQALSRIEFTRTGTGRTNVEHGKESLGRSVEAQVQQAKDVPEKFTLAVPVWSTSGFGRFAGQVEFGIYLDLEAQTVELRVLADEVERVRNLALAQVVTELSVQIEKATGSVVPVFLGKP